MDSLRKPTSFIAYYELPLKEKQKLWAEEMKAKKQEEKKKNKRNHY